MIDWTSVGVNPNIDAERSVVGAILVDADNIMPECEEMLSENDFLIPEYRTLYRTMNGYFVDGKPIDVVTLLAQHGDAYKAVIAEAVQSMPSIRNWKSYAQIVMDTAKRHRAFESVEMLIGYLSANEKIQDCQALAVRACEQLSTTTNDNTVSAKEGFAKFYSALQKPEDYIYTGFKKLDRHTFICRGDFVVIGARPSVGKTALTLQMLLHMSRSRRVAYFSLETRNNNLFGRMAANLSGINLRAIKTQNGLDFYKLSQAGKLFDGLNFYAVEAAGWTVPQIKAKSVQLGAEVVIIDYLGLIKAQGQKLYERVSNISLDLHTMALSGNMAIIALCQLNREGRSEPTMEHLRESGQIEQDADVILLLHAPDGIEASARKVVIAKNKEGQVGSVSLDFDGSLQRFSEIEMRYGNG